MRLHLDTSSTTGATGANSSSPIAEKSGSSSINNLSTDSNLRDSVAVSGASNAWADSFSNRTAKIGQLTAAVQGGTYRVSSNLVSQAIMASATA
jgi:anti-sigma28 factor (negative regulator of flagellin synthesis)